MNAEETKTAKMLARVRALLAKADDRGVTAEEAESFRSKADELMTRFAIDQFMIDQAEAGHTVQQPERRDFGRAEGKFRWELDAMFRALARHCRCVVGERGRTYAGVPVFGLPSDLDYLDMLFTTLQLEVAKNLQPPVDAEGDLGEQVFKQRQAGIGWADITRKLYDAGLVDLTKGERAKLDQRGIYRGEQAFDVDYRPTFAEIKDNEALSYGKMYREELGEVTKSIKNRLANANRRYVRDNGLDMDRNYVKPEVYQRSFILGFEDEIRHRLRTMEHATRKSYDAQNKSDQFAVAVRDVRAMALALYEEAYPPPPPPKPLTPEQLAELKKQKLPAVREVTVDYSAMSAGRRKASQVNLTNNPSRRVSGDRKGLK